MIDSILMLGAYGWAYVNPLRKLHDNMTITLGLGGRGAGVGRIDDNLGNIGFLIVAIFIGAWLLSWAIWRARGCDSAPRSAE